MKYTLYHGSGARFDAFKDVGASQSYAPDTYFFSDSKAHALEYAFHPQNDGRYLYECDVTMNHPLVVDCKNAGWNNIPTDGFPKDMQRALDESGYGTSTDCLVNLINDYKLPYDGIIFRNVKDNLRDLCPVYLTDAGYQYEAFLKQHPQFADRTLRRGITADQCDYFTNPTSSYCVLSPSQIQIRSCIDLSALPHKETEREAFARELDEIRNAIPKDAPDEQKELAYRYLSNALETVHMQLKHTIDGFYLTDRDSSAVVMYRPTFDALATSVYVQAVKALPSHFKLPLGRDEKRDAKRCLDAACAMKDWYTSISDPRYSPFLVDVPMPAAVDVTTRRNGREHYLER